MKETALWLVGARTRIRVVGASMEPTLREGEFVLIDSNKVPRQGDLAVFTHPKMADVSVVKRVTEIDGSGDFIVSCDNPLEGSDSRTWGPLAADSVKGAVTIVLDRPTD